MNEYGRQNSGSRRGQEAEQTRRTRSRRGEEAEDFLSRVWVRLVTSAATFGLLLATGVAAETKVRTERLPDSGVQPKIVADSKGTWHLVYLAGKPAEADVFYRQRKAGDSDWSTPV